MANWIAAAHFITGNFVLGSGSLELEDEKPQILNPNFKLHAKAQDPHRKNPNSSNMPKVGGMGP